VLVRAAAQVGERLLDGDPVAPRGRDPADPAKRVVRPVARGPDDRGHGPGPGGAPGRHAAGDFEEGLDTGLVVGEIHDHDAPPVPEDVEASG
jgi:hypothetical protein